MKHQTLSTLLGGHFVCPVAFPAEYEDLLPPQNQAEVEEWLSKLDRRLARLGEDGAFYVAPLQVQAQHAAKVRDDMRGFRDTYGPLVSMLNLIRVAKEGFACTPGDYIQLAELEQAVNESETIAAQLRGLIGIITNSAARLTNREVLKRLLEHLRSAGYLVVANATNETYRVTGKVDHLHMVLEFIAEQQPAIAQDAQDGQEEEGAAPDLLQSAYLSTPQAVDYDLAGEADSAKQGPAKGDGGG